MVHKQNYKRKLKLNGRNINTEKAAPVQHHQ